MTRRIYAILCLLIVLSVNAQEASMTLSIQKCRQLAIKNNKELRMTDSDTKAAYYERKAAFTKYFPRISATGAYIHTSKELSLLNDEQKEKLGNLGSYTSALLPSLQDKSATLDAIGGSLVDALHTDTRNMGAIGVTLTQPIYMGGKINAYNRITRYAEQIAASQLDLTLQNVIVEVDEAYWRIILLQSKKELAESYLELVQKLDNDVQCMIAEGIATKADGLSVKVKVNEAEVTIIQINNGLSISKMLLCQLCGLDINTDISLEDESAKNELDNCTPASVDVNTALSQRLELKMLSLSSDIYTEKVKLSRAEFLPSIFLTGGYLATNPSVFNSFERKMNGMWNVGVVVNIPLVTFGERCYKVKAARAQETTARLRLDETREKVELQVNQNLQKVQEASERLVTAKHSCDEADENLRYATLGLQEGVIPVSNVLEAQTAWLKSHSEYISSQIDLKLSNLYLLKSAGTLTDNN